MICTKFHNSTIWRSKRALFVTICEYCKAHRKYNHLAGSSRGGGGGGSGNVRKLYLIYEAFNLTVKQGKE